MSNTKPTVAKKAYNLSEITHEFKLSLVAGKKSPATIKNYVSDLRHYLGWLQNNTKNDIFYAFTHSSTQQLLSYREYLVLDKTPTKTINRRLSALRLFFSFCISQQWMTENPAKNILNMDRNLVSSTDTTLDLISRYIHEKELSGESKKQIRATKSSLIEFITITHSLQKLYEK